LVDDEPEDVDKKVGKDKAGVEGKTKAKAKKKGTSKAKAPTGPMPLGAMAAVLVAALVMTSSIGLYLFGPRSSGGLVEEQGPASSVEDVERGVRTDLWTNIDLIAIREGARPGADAGPKVAQAIDGFVARNYAQAEIEGHLVNVDVASVNMTKWMNPIQLDDVGEVQVPYSYNLVVELNVSVDGIGRTERYDRVVPVIMPFIETLHGIFTNNTESEFTHVGRMVKYMLTTLVRYRTFLGQGSGPYQTEKDLLNEGDVELAINIALIIEEMRLFHSWDRDAVNAIDLNYFDAMNPVAHEENGWFTDNPTGLRPWGNAEKDNYFRYLTRSSSSGRQRLADILSDTFERSSEDLIYIDPSNVLTIYLNYDDAQNRWLTSEGLLDKHMLKDPRDMATTVPDPANLVVTTAISDRPYELSDMSDKPDPKAMSLVVDQYPNYLIVGQDIQVGPEIADPLQYVTNVKLAGDRSTGSRTGGVPPPQPQPLHDFYSLWRFNVTGRFDICVRQEERFNDAGNEVNVELNRSVQFDIPLSIFAWYILAPANVALGFVNLNAGSPPGDTTNFTNESILYEVFAEDQWPAMQDVQRGITGLALDLASIAVTVPEYTYGYGSQPVLLNRLVPAPSSDLEGFIDDYLIPFKTLDIPLRPLLHYDCPMVIDGGVDASAGGDWLVVTTQSSIGDISLYAWFDGGAVTKWFVTATGLNIGHATMDLKYTPRGAGSGLGSIEATMVTDEGMNITVMPDGSGHNITVSGGSVP